MRHFFTLWEENEELTPEQAPARAALCASTVLGLALTRYVLRFPASRALAP